MKILANARLILSVHRDAFRSDPRAYLTAAKWWLLRKRVRARGQFAPLLGQSPEAYALWGTRDEWDHRGPSPHGQQPPIIALVAADRFDQHLDETLASLAEEGVSSFLIGPNWSQDIAASSSAIDWSQSPSSHQLQ